MNSIVKHMHKYDHGQHVLSDWLAELEQRFQLGEVDDDNSKITWCQLLIGATGSSILSGLEDDASWETAKETLLSCLGIGSVKDKAWAALKHLKKGSKEIVELAGEAKKLAKRLHLAMRKRLSVTPSTPFLPLWSDHWRQRCRNWGAAPWKMWLRPQEGLRRSLKSRMTLKWSGYSCQCRTKSGS